MRIQSLIINKLKLKVMSQLIATYLLLGVLGMQSLSASAETRPGASCVKAGKVKDVAATKYVCARSGKRLVWTVVSVPSTSTTTLLTTTSITTVPVTSTTVAASTTTTTTTVAADKTPPVVTLLRGRGSSTTTTLTFTVTGDEPIKCSTLSTSFDEDFTWDKISIIGSIVQTSTTVCTITAFSTAERDNDDHIATLRASANFSITDTAGNAQRTLLGSPQSTTVKRA